MAEFVHAPRPLPAADEALLTSVPYEHSVLLLRALLVVVLLSVAARAGASSLAPHWAVRRPAYRRFARAARTCMRPPVQKKME